MSDALRRAQFVQQLECSICGSYDDLNLFAHSKSTAIGSSTRTSGNIKTKTTTYNVQTTQVPLCEKCKKKKKNIQRKSNLVGVFFLIYILIFFPLLIFTALNLFWDLLSIVLFGILIIPIKYVLGYSHSYNSINFVNIWGGDIYLFSRKTGEWLGYQTWAQNVIINRMKMTNTGIPAFPRRKTRIWKLQYFGSLLVVISILLPYSINFSSGSINVSWLAGMSIHINPTSISTSNLYNIIYNSYIPPVGEMFLIVPIDSLPAIITLVSGMISIFFIVILSYRNLVNCAQLKKSENSIEYVEKFIKKDLNYQILSLINFSVFVFLYHFIFLQQITYFSLQSLVLGIAIIITLIGYKNASKQNFRIKSASDKIESPSLPPRTISNDQMGNELMGDINAKDLLMKMVRKTLQDSQQTDKTTFSTNYTNTNNNWEVFCPSCKDVPHDQDYNKFCRKCGQKLNRRELKS